MSSKAKGKNARDKHKAPATEAAVWILLAVAGLATVYFLMREPEDGPVTALPRAMAQARALALVASCLGTIPGLWHILRGRRDPNLFAMAVLFHLMLACYWILRITLS